MLGTIGDAAGLARLSGRPAARLHAPVQHHRGQPARRARRRPARWSTTPRPVARKLQPFAKRLRGFAATPSRPSGASTAIVKAPGPGQRPDRAHPRCRIRSPRSGSARWTANGASRPGAPPGLRRCAARLPRPGLHAARLQPGADRLVRRLRPLRLPGRVRRHRPDRDHPQRVQPERLPASRVCGARSEIARRTLQRPQRQRALQAPSAPRSSGAAPARTSAASATTSSPRAAPSTATRPRRRSDHEADRWSYSRCSPAVAGRSRRRSRAPTTATPTRSSCSTPSASSRARSSGSRARRPARSPTSTSTPQKTRVGHASRSTPDFPELKADASCSSEPQSLIAEYFIDCEPGSRARSPLRPGPIPAGPQQDHGPARPRQNTLREPYKRPPAAADQRVRHRARRQRREPERGDPLRRSGAPAARSRSSRSSATRTGRSRDLNANADAIFAQLADRREDVVRFIDKAGRHRRDLGRAPGRPRAELRPARRLPRPAEADDDPARQARRPSRRRCSPTCTRPPRASTSWRRTCRPSTTAPEQSLTSLGDAAHVGKTALANCKDEIAALDQASTKAFPAADQIANFLETSTTRSTPSRRTPAPAGTSASSRARRTAVSSSTRSSARTCMATRPSLQVGNVPRDQPERRQPRLHRDGGPPQLRLLPDQLAEPVRPARARCSASPW